MSRGYVTNLELRDSTSDGSEGAGLSHTAEGMFLLHVLELAAEGEPKGGVTVVHDAGEHGGRYDALAGELADAGWAVALPDLRGHGRSEGARGHSWGIKEPLRDIDSVQDHLAYRMPDAPKAIVGQGLGALYSLAYALEQPDRVSALVLIGPWLEPNGTPPPKPGGLKGMFKKPQATDLGSLGIRVEDWVSDPEEQRARAADELVHDSISRHTLERLPGESQAVCARASSVSVPTLVLHSADDKFASLATAQRVLSGDAYTFEVLEGRRHDVLREPDAEAVRARIVSFIESQA